MRSTLSTHVVDDTSTNVPCDALSNSCQIPIRTLLLSFPYLAVGPSPNLWVVSNSFSTSFGRSPIREGGTNKSYNILTGLFFHTIVSNTKYNVQVATFFLFLYFSYATAPSPPSPYFQPLVTILACFQSVINKWSLRTDVCSVVISEKKRTVSMLLVQTQILIEQYRGPSLSHGELPP